MVADRLFSTGLRPRARSMRARPLLLAALACWLAAGGEAVAQWQPQWSPRGTQPPQALPPPPSGFGTQAQTQGQRSPMCQRLESQLAGLDRPDPERAEQIRRYEDAANRQQQEIDRMTAQARRSGCGGGFFLFGGGNAAQCDQINNQIQRMRVNQDRILAGLRQLQGSGGHDREEQRRTILASLAQYDCGPQYRVAGRRGGFFESLFGGNTMAPPPGAEGTPYYQSTGYRTLCVRTCDGYFFPVSFSTMPERFEDDERACQRMCPAAEVMLFTHRNPGEEVEQAVSTYGQPYTELPNAFRYRTEFDASCTCRRPDANWADALADDDTLERGDIVVTEDRARQLSRPQQKGQGQGTARGQGQPQQGQGQPQQGQGQPRGAAASAQARGQGQTPPAPPAAGQQQQQPAEEARTTTQPRSVGPQFYR